MNINCTNGIKFLNNFKLNNAQKPSFQGYVIKDSFERQQTNNPDEISFNDFLHKYNYSENQATREIQSGELRIISDESLDKITKRTSFLRSVIDLKSPDTIATLEKHLKLKPVQSDMILNATTGYYPPVSVQYLSKLGYGSPKELAILIKKGYLEGNIKKINTPEGEKTSCTVDLSSKANKAKLQNLRERNGNTIEVSKFAKTLGLTMKELEQKTLDGEVEIIPRFIYPEDYKKVFYSLNNPKNKEFLEKRQFEQELIQQNKMTRSDMSLKMKLIWYFAPNTRLVAHKLAMQNGLAKIAIAKSKKGIELDEHEKEALNAYYNSIWSKAGIMEYKKAREWGEVVYEDYKKGGIEAIEDPELREFILNIVNSEE